MKPAQRRQQIAWWFTQAGCGVDDLASMFGVNRATVYRDLRAAGAIEPQGRGAPRRDTCLRGHDLTEHGRERKRGGGRECRECKRMRQRVGWKRAEL